MTEPVLDTKNLAATIAEYIDRCALILEEVFQRGSVSDFRAWLERRFQEGDVLMLLHDAPLDAVCRYLGETPRNLNFRVEERMAQLASLQGWDKT
jgi:hypothetical protein